MAVSIIKERWTSKVAELQIGEGPKAVKVGGESTLPHLRFEGEIPNGPVVALEIFDVQPEETSPFIAEAFAGVMNDPVAWAKKCVEYGADMVTLRLISAHPDNQNASPEEVAKTAKAVADAIDVPLMILGCGVEEKDQEMLPVVADALTGKNCLIGCLTPENYKPIVAACIGAGHSVIASSPLDINLAKQLNILLTEMNLPASRIVIDPLIGALGYGIEYAYSIMERARIGALTGDKMLAMPVVCFVGQEAWKAKEAKAEDAEWGDLRTRAIIWETMTASTLLGAGGSIFVMRHPDSMVAFRKHVDAISKSNAY